MYPQFNLFPEFFCVRIYVKFLEGTVGTFWGQVQFLFFPDCRTLKFLKMKCNTTNKKLWSYIWH